MAWWDSSADGGAALQGSDNDWMNMLQFGLQNIAAPILNSQFGGPQAGQYYNNQKTGVTAYALPANTVSAGFNTFPGVSVGGGWGSLLIPGLVVVGIVMLMSGGNKGK